MANDIVVCDSKHQSFLYVNFRTDTRGKDMNSFMPHQIGVKLYNYSHFYKDGFGMKLKNQPTNQLTGVLFLLIN